MSLVKEVLFYCNISTKKVTKITQHRLNYYDLTFVLKGSLTYIIDGKKYILKENDAIFLIPGMMRERLSQNNSAKYVSFNFLPDKDITLDTFQSSIINDEIKRLVSVFPSSHLADSFHSKEKLESILNYILYELIDNAGYKSKNPHIIKIFKFIQANLSQNLTLDQVANYVNLSKEYTAALFKKETGKTVIDYINERKMIVAKNMIDSHQSSLKDIALSLGFENYSYFSRLFKKYHDSSPVKRKNI